jgi:hypothetical protein
MKMVNFMDPQNSLMVKERCCLKDITNEAKKQEYGNFMKTINL